MLKFPTIKNASSERHGLQSVVRQEDDEEPDPEKILKNLTDSVVLLGQAINKMAYERRMSVLADLSDIKNAKRRLRDIQEDINREQMFLFGEEFQKHIKTLQKHKILLRSCLQRIGMERKDRHHQAGHPNNSRPFSGGSSNNYHHSRGGAQSNSTRG